MNSKVRVPLSFVTSKSRTRDILIALRSWENIFVWATYVFAFFVIIMLLVNRDAFTLFSLVTFIVLSSGSAIISVITSDKYNIYALRRHASALLRLGVSIFFIFTYVVAFFQVRQLQYAFSIQFMLITTCAVFIVVISYVYPLYVQIDRLKRMDVEKLLLDRFGFSTLLSVVEYKTKGYIMQTQPDSSSDLSQSLYTPSEFRLELERSLESTKIHTLQVISFLPIVTCPFVISLALFLINIT